MAESMVFYKSFYDAIKELPEDNRYEILKAIIEYGLLGVEPKLTGIPQAVFLLIKPQIDANNKRRENGKYGVLGGRPKKKPTETKIKPIGLSVTKPNGLSKKNPNVNVNVNVNENNTSSSCACAREDDEFLGDEFDENLETYEEYLQRVNRKRG